MIELQGGEIGVSSRPGHGATFAFYIRLVLQMRRSQLNKVHPTRYCRESKHWRTLELSSQS